MSAKKETYGVKMKVIEKITWNESEREKVTNLEEIKQTHLILI